MNKQQESLNILLEAVNLAQSRGAFNFDEAAMVKKAIDTFTKPEAPAEVSEPKPLKAKKNK